MSLEKSPWQPEVKDTAEQFQHQSLELLAQQLQRLPQPVDYPAFNQRLYSPFMERTLDGRPELRLGPWDTPHMLPTGEEYASFAQLEVDTDQWGRPIHPWLEAMMTDPRIGVVTGKGEYYHWGPNYTVDPIVLCGDYILLIQRGDSGAWALPGGFVDGDELIEVAGRRELAEETGLCIDSVEPVKVYEGPVADIRMTAHAGPVTTALLFELDANQPLPSVQGMDDAHLAAWVPLSKVEQLDLFGSHPLLIERALAQHQTLETVSGS